MRTGNASLLKNEKESAKVAITKSKQKKKLYNESTNKYKLVRHSTAIMRPALKPLGRYQIVSIVSCAMLFTAFLFLLLVALSLPIIKSIYVVKLTSEVTEASPLSIATQLRFGVWGVCAIGYVHSQYRSTNLQIVKCFKRSQQPQ